MICNQCGTESRELFCPRCGAPMLAGRPAANAEPAPAAVKEPDPIVVVEPEEKPRTETVQKPKDAEPVAKTKEQTVKRPTRRPPLRFSMVFWQAVALLFPLAYLFFDGFVVYSDLLFLNSAGGEMHLILLIERLASSLYAGNSVAELAEATLGESAVLTQSVSLSALMAGEELASTFLIPFVVLLVFVAICAVCAVFLLLTGGRILRWRAFCNLAMLGGTGATFAPMIGMLIEAVSYTVRRGIGAADDMMLRMSPSFEYLCIMGLLMCALLPAVSSIKGLSSYARRQNNFLTAPFGTLEKRSFVCKKVLAAIFLVLACPVAVGFFLLPVTKSGALSVPGAIDGFASFYRTMMTYKDALAAGAAPEHLSVVTALLRVAKPFATAVVLLCGLLVLYDLCRILAMRSVESTKKKGALRVLKHVEMNVRGAVLAPYICFVSLQVIAAIFLLVATPAISHLNFSNVDATLSVLYLAIAYVRTTTGTGVLYAFMTVCGLLLWYMMGRCVDAMYLSELVLKKKKKSKKSSKSDEESDEKDDKKTDRKKARA